MILLRREVIVWSTARLNEDQSMDSDRKHYAMCHELGHGFGLPHHSDENHFNINRGDCMDYTTRARSNQLPGQHNCHSLKKLYGTPDEPLVFGSSATDVSGTTSGNLRPNRNGSTRRMENNVFHGDNSNLMDESVNNSTTSTILQESSEEEESEEESSDEEPVPMDIQQMALEQVGWQICMTAPDLCAAMTLTLIVQFVRVP